MIVDENGICTLDEEDMSYHTNPKAEYKYFPDGDRCYYDPKYCDGEPCPVDCYRCPIGTIIENANAEKEDEE